MRAAIAQWISALPSYNGIADSILAAGELDDRFYYATRPAPRGHFKMSAPVAAVAFVNSPQHTLASVILTSQRNLKEDCEEYIRGIRQQLLKYDGI
ncbi:hypothetical protein EVAR_98782_1 [Eumeta japonica]|uniref:Uncharacterized protein n=1 Tax=Eumeta variegata TaxID=151549 RepID=A0A4C1YT08_EUMVA|nr:hypothetical protein EVAR_98782_1 [Eumeta japonica]